MEAKILVFQILVGIFSFFYIFPSSCYVVDYDDSETKTEQFNFTHNRVLNFPLVYSDAMMEELDHNETMTTTEKIEEETTAESTTQVKREADTFGLSDETKMRILYLHNLYRTNVTPPAGNMNFLEWDEELETLAGFWAEKCVFEHGKPTEATYGDHYGQNLYMGTDPTGIQGVWMWYEEHIDYDYHNKSCAEGKQCGHYYAMAWAPTRKVGCAMSKCGYRYYLVCHYHPGVITGVQIYDVSKPCSQCTISDGTLCYKNLCITKDQCERNPEICEKAVCNLECHNCGKLNEEACRCDCADGWDTRDCSRICTDSHERCRKKPGFFNKATCSLNQYAVANIYCRKMCGKCHAIEENFTYDSNVCCNGKLCPEGHVLDMDRKPCRCTLLCPGVQCDLLEATGIMHKISISTLAFVMLIFYLFH